MMGYRYPKFFIRNIHEEKEKRSIASELHIFPKIKGEMRTSKQMS